MKDLNETRSLWENFQTPSYPSLNQNGKADVCIVGAGIVGLTAAYLLQKHQKSVWILEKDENVGLGQTCRTSGHLCSALDDRFHKLKKLFPNDLRDILESQLDAVDLIEKIVTEEKIDCDFSRVDGYLFLAPETSKNVLSKEYQVLKEMGFAHVEALEQTPLPSFTNTPCLKFSEQAQFHPLKYLARLAEIVTERGGKIFNSTKVEKIAYKPLRVVAESGYEVKAHSVIIAANTPFNDRMIMHTKQAPYRTYVIGGAIPKGSFPKALFWDTAEPYNYLRIYEDPQKDQDILLIGGADHKTGQEQDTENAFAKLEKWSQKYFPMLQEITYRWSGQILEPVDSLAFAGRNPMDDPNVYIATGDSGNGLTFGTMAGILITDLILEKKSPWEKIYDPARKTLKSFNEYAKENFNVALQYLQWTTPAPSESESEENSMPFETGKILQDGIKKHAVYKDEKGTIHRFSPICSHLGGCVNWNTVEKTWDCPCHGSRFDKYGKLIDGPAINDLEKL